MLVVFNTHLSKETLFVIFSFVHGFHTYEFVSGVRNISFSADKEKDCFVCVQRVIKYVLDRTLSCSNVKRVFGLKRIFEEFQVSFVCHL